MKGFLDWASRGLAAGMLPGSIVGLVVGGLGSRTAMRVMAMTSPRARGFETDFGATVGEITLGGTLFLLIAGIILGALGGIAYLAIRNLIPGTGWLKGLAFGAVLLALTGRLLVVPDNPDFVILSPAGLAVAMFTALPLLFGLFFVPLAERLEPFLAGVRRPGWVILPVALGVALLIPALGLGLIVIAGTLVAWMIPASFGPRQRHALRVGGQVLLGAAILWRGVVFISAVTDIL
jgi:hypothetical protein